MTIFDSITIAPDNRLLCWTLMHFLWQGVVIALALGGARAALHRGTAKAKYGVSCAAMLQCAAAPLVTFAVLRGHDNRGHAIAAPISVVVDARADAARAAEVAVLPAIGPSADVAPASVSISDRINAAAPIIVGAWIFGASLLAVWRLAGWTWAQTLRRRGSLISNPDWQVRLMKLQGILGVRRMVRLIGTPRLDSPAVIGLIRPAILLPISCLAALSPSQMEAILAHELAHIRRHDYLLNLIQTIIETALFFHPAVWWISARITDDREDCCDDIAADVLGDRLRYASSLATLETLRAPPPPVLAATGGVLLRRIRRIVGSSDAAARGTWWPVGAAMMTLLVLLTVQNRTAAADPPATHPTAESRSIDVLCLDESGKPIAGADVYVVERVSGTPDSTMTKHVANADGIVHVQGLPIGDKIKSGQQMAYARVPGKLAGFGLRVWGSPSIEAEPQLRVFMRSPVPYRGKIEVPWGIDPTSLRVKVIAVSGVPPPGTNLSQTFSPSDENSISPWPELFERTLHTDGTFELTEMPAGCTVDGEIYGPGIATRSLIWGRQARNPEDPMAMSVDPESVLEGRVIFDPPGAPIPGLTVSAVSYDRSDRNRLIFYRVNTGPDGTFRFDKLAQGTYDIKILNLPDGWISAGLRTRVVRGETAVDAIIRLERGIVLSGTVVDNDTSLPLQGAEVMARVVTPSRSQTSAWSDAQGRFYMRVPAVTLNVFVNRAPEGYGRMRDIQVDLSDPAIAVSPPALSVRLARNGGGQAGQTAVSARGSATRPGPVTPDSLATVRGRVIDNAGKPVGDIIAWLQFTVPGPDGRELPRKGIRTNPDGMFEIRTLSDSEERVIAIQKWNTNPGVSKPFTLKGGDTVDIGDLIVERRPVESQVSGILQDEKRRPVVNARVTIMAGIEQTSGADGSFRFDLYNREPVTLQVMAPAFEARQFNQVPTGPEQVILRLNPRNLGETRTPPSPLRLIGQAAPEISILQWLLNPPMPDNPMPLIRADRRKTVLLFPQCCVATTVYRQQIQMFDQLCRRSSVAGAVVFEPAYQEYTLKAIFEGIQVSIPVGIDQPTDQGYVGAYGLTKGRYGTVDRTHHTILIIDADGKVQGHLTTLEELEQVLKGL